MKIIEGENALACIINGHKVLLHSDIRPFVTLFSTDKKHVRIPLQKYEKVSQDEIVFFNGNISAKLISVNDGSIALIVPQKYDASIIFNFDGHNDITQNGISLDKRYIVNKNNKPLKEKASCKIDNFFRYLFYLNVKREHFTIDTEFELGDYGISLSCPPKVVDCTFKNSLTILCSSEKPIQIQIIDIPLSK